MTNAEIVEFVWSMTVGELMEFVKELEAVLSPEPEEDA